MYWINDFFSTLKLQDTYFYIKTVEPLDNWLTILYKNMCISFTHVLNNWFFSTVEIEVHFFLHQKPLSHWIIDSRFFIKTCVFHSHMYWIIDFFSTVEIEIHFSLYQTPLSHWIIDSRFFIKHVYFIHTCTAQTGAARGSPLSLP